MVIQISRVKRKIASTDCWEKLSWTSSRPWGCSLNHENDPIWFFHKPHFICNFTLFVKLKLFTLWQLNLTRNFIGNPKDGLPRCMIIEFEKWLQLYYQRWLFYLNLHGNNRAKANILRLARTNEPLSLLLNVRHILLLIIVTWDKTRCQKI